MYEKKRKLINGIWNIKDKKAGLWNKAILSLYEGDKEEEAHKWGIKPKIKSKQ